MLQRNLEDDTRAFLPMLGEALYYGMKSTWTTMRAYLGKIDAERLRSPQLALFYALRGVAASGENDTTAALHDAHVALNLGRPLAREPSADGRLRMLARVLGIAILVRANRQYDAFRAFTGFQSRMNGPMRAFAETVLHGAFDIESAPTLRGYIRMLQNLAEQRSPGSNAAVLTKRELDVLHGFVDGGTARTIAADLNLRMSTVTWHAANIRSKLGANRMLGAIEKARGLRLIP